MKIFEVNGKVREALGKKSSKALRVNGLVPCVLYGTEAPVHFYSVQKDFKGLVYTPDVQIVELNIDGKKCQALMQDIQFHPVTDEILHIDFLRIKEDKPVKVSIPIEVKGFAKGIKAGGKLQLQVRKLTISALPKDLPDRIEIDVTELDVNQSIRVGDIKDTNITFLNPKSLPVIRITMTRAARAAQQKEEDAKK